MLKQKAVSCQYNDDGSVKRSPPPKEWFAKFKPQGVGIAPGTVSRGTYKQTSWIDEPDEIARFAEIEPKIDEMATDIKRMHDSNLRAAADLESRCPINEVARKVLHETESVQHDQKQHIHCSGNIVYFAPMGSGCTFDNSGSRGSICDFSAGSAKRMRRYLRSCRAQYAVMLTLTYPGEYSTDGKRTKEHLKRMLQELKRQRARDNGGVADDDYSCFWFLEFQKRGAPHYHLLLTDRFDKDWISSTWYRIVGSGCREHLQAGTRIEALRGGKRAAMAYASKYANKSEQKIAPAGFRNIGRWWGISGDAGVKAADCVLRKSEMSDEVISRRFRVLKTVLDQAVLAGTATLKTDKNGCLVWFLNVEYIAAVVRSLIRNLEMSVCALRGKPGTSLNANG